MARGLLLVNTGQGKGKTTAALGTTLRALGQGLRVAFLQFIKNQKTGESRFLEEYAAGHPDRLLYRRLGLGFIGADPSAEDRVKAAEALELARKLTAEGYDLLVLDEICFALARGLIEVPAVLELIKNRPPSQHLILTGRGCPEEILALADTVTEMRPIRHAYEKGLPAAKGIEF